MKLLSASTLFSLLIMSAIPQYSLAQIDALKILSNGNIGISNEAPAAKLHVGGPLGGTAMSTTFITNAGSLGKSYQSELPLGSIGFTTSNNKVALGIRALRSVNNTDSGWGTTAIGLGVDVDNSARAGGAALWFSANGNIGIGTAAPQKALDIAAEGGIRISRTEGLSNTPSKNEIFFQDNGQIRSSDNNHRLIFNRSNNTMELREFGDIVFSAGTNGDNGTQSMVIKANGNIGIGTPNPGANLHIGNTATAASFVVGATDNGYTSLITRLSSLKDGYAYIQGIKAQGTAWGDIILNKDGGNVGIGLTNPTQARLVISGKSTNNALPINDQLTFGNQVTRGTTGSKELSLYATDGIAAKIIYLFSDERIKTVVQQSNAAQDLLTLLKIRVTDFRYKDVISRGADTYKKVIAQQVEKVFPQAVSQITDVVPDIYKKASFKNGWVLLINDLKIGERVKLVTGNEAAVYEVLEAKNSMFRINCTYTGNEVFVYGREVKDFRMVDYESIAMLNVSATQELAKQLEALKKDNTDMKKRLQALEAKVKQ